MTSAHPNFDALVAEHGGRVLGICTSIVRDEHLGADAAQEAFLRLWHQLRKSERPASLAAWLRTAAVSSALDLLRRRRVRDDAAQVVGTQPAEEFAPDPSAPLEALELRMRLGSALQRLPEGQRGVFVLRHEAGLGLGEVARTLGVAESTVKTQFARACLRLQEHLAPFAPEIRRPARSHPYPPSDSHSRGGPS